MRDPGRVSDIPTKVQSQRVENPELILMQLLINAIIPDTPRPVLYYLEDDELMKQL